MSDGVINLLLYRAICKCVPQDIFKFRSSGIIRLISSCVTSKSEPFMQCFSPAIEPLVLESEMKASVIRWHVEDRSLIRSIHLLSGLQCSFSVPYFFHTLYDY